MKTVLLLAVSLSCASMAVQADTQSFILDKYTEQALISVCSHTADDDRLSLNKTLKAHRISRQNAVEKIVCNGKQLMDFARYNQAVRVTRMLQPYEDRVKGKVTIQDIATSAPN